MKKIESIFKFKTILDDSIQFSSKFKVLNQSGNIVYEYNPFRNYRLTNYKFEYQSKLYDLSELDQIFNIKLYFGNNNTPVKNITNEDLVNKLEWVWKKNEIIMDKSVNPILRKIGELVDFDTNELQFDLSHPVQIEPQYSYDGSVNLILNDGKNIPRLINSRFSPIGKNKYQIIDRKGDNDTNIYDQGAQFDIDTSLYKKTNSIPKLKYLGTFLSGNLSIGSYHFYFKYMDADGNETDFISESGKVDIFIGYNPQNINSGFRNQNSYKGVSFILSNLDSGYQYISIYYTKSSSDINQNSVTSAFKINQKFIINSSNICSIKITGFENCTEIPISDINLNYQIVDASETQASCQNMLFLGNVSKSKIDYRELTDISLRFLPKIIKETYDISNKVTPEYQTQVEYNDSYYNSKFIYDKTGYWPDEIYRFGIVYILKDNTLSPVFNVRGIKEINETIDNYSNFPFYEIQNEKKVRKYITYEEETNIIFGSELCSNNQFRENCKGVVKFSSTASDSNYCIYGISFEIQDNQKKDILQKLKELGIQGFFFVRQKRIPTILCQAFTIGSDKQSHVPAIPYQDKYIVESFLSSGNHGQELTENTQKYLTHNYDTHIRELNVNEVNTAAICPEYDINMPYYNTIFNGDKFIVDRDHMQPNSLYRLPENSRYYYTGNYHGQDNSSSEETNIQAIEDNVKLVAIDNVLFSSRAGDAEDALKYEYIGTHDSKVSDNVYLVRGSFGPYLGFKKLSYLNKIINIRIPGYSSNDEYFNIRYGDKSPFYAISDRYSLKDMYNDFTETYYSKFDCYRGDCYICQFTHRINRNFQDSTSPTNDLIVDPNTWKTNYTIEADGVINYEKSSKINVGDVNAVQLGQWITFVVRSTHNLNIRALDESYVDEQSVFGHPRTFVPYTAPSTKGVYKIPESLCYNKGFEKSLSERVNFETPDVPAIKNDFTNRIVYSDINVNDAFKNGFRTFRGGNYRDYPKTYGQITKLIELQGNLLCVFEHGIALIPVNERALTGQGQGGNIYINTSNVLPENPKIISDTFGSQWKESIIKTPRGVYGVDTNSKKIWRTNGQNFECISDFKVQEFLNQNISLTEREITPIIGIRNVKTHYNKFKGDVLFTFYDNLYGFEEKVWNLCWNELQEKFITFYSWVPSYSENIYNQFFTFDRNTSKQIAKLGISNYYSTWADGITLENNVIENQEFITNLHLSNRNLNGSNIEITYKLGEDSFGNNQYFTIIDNNKLKFIGNLEDIESKIYELEGESFKLNKYGHRIELDNPYHSDKIVLYLNIIADIKMTFANDSSKHEFNNSLIVDSGSYQSVVALIPKSNKKYLSTDFWKHGQGGVIDISDKIYPTNWYGKQHPFEFEFIVNNNPQFHKIFDNLEIISNNAEPESFHYEIVGDCYDFAKDKQNMYVRQEATKELYQNLGSNITFDHDYTALESEHQHIKGSHYYKKSTILPLYYSRQDTVNEIEDSYHLKDGTSSSKDFSALSGGEITYNKNLNEFRIWNHNKAINLNDKGRMRGNMQYKEDKWNIQINPLLIVQKNETDWNNRYIDLLHRSELDDIVPIELGQNPLPNDISPELSLNQIPLNSKHRAIVKWNWEESYINESKLKDKWIKIRIRYSGKKLAIITAIKTLYSISYA